MSSVGPVALTQTRGRYRPMGVETELRDLNRAYSLTLDTESHINGSETVPLSGAGAP